MVFKSYVDVILVVKTQILIINITWYIWNEMAEHLPCDLAGRTTMNVYTVMVLMLDIIPTCQKRHRIM